MRVRPPSLPLHVAATPAPPTVKTWSFVPSVRPLTGPSKVRVMAIVSPTLLPPEPDSAVMAMPGATPSVGAERSSAKTTAALGAPGLPATSVREALRLFEPSAPRSAAATVKST